MKRFHGFTWVSRVMSCSWLLSSFVEVFRRPAVMLLPFGFVWHGFLPTILCIDLNLSYDHMYLYCNSLKQLSFHG